MYDTATTPTIEAAIHLYLEQLANYELWLAGEEAAEAIDAISEAA